MNTATTTKPSAARTGPAAMARLTRRSTKELRAMFAQAHGRNADGMTRDSLIKEMATRADVPAFPAEPVKQQRSAATPKREPVPKPPERDSSPRAADARIPAAGGTIAKTYKGREIRVEVLDSGFRCSGKDWSSLTALALSITGYKAISGPAFFGIATRKPAQTGGAQ